MTLRVRPWSSVTSYQRVMGIACRKTCLLSILPPAMHTRHVGLQVTVGPRWMARGLHSLGRAATVQLCTFLSHPYRIHGSLPQRASHVTHQGVPCDPGLRIACCTLDGTLDGMLDGRVHGNAPATRTTPLLPPCQPLCLSTPCGFPPPHSSSASAFQRGRGGVDEGEWGNVPQARGHPEVMKKRYVRYHPCHATSYRRDAISVRSIPQPRLLVQLLPMLLLSRPSIISQLQHGAA